MPYVHDYYMTAVSSRAEAFQIYTVGSVIASRSSNMPTLIGMRCLQATGSAAVVAVGAGSLADMFEVHERGQKVSYDNCFLWLVLG